MNALVIERKSSHNAGSNISTNDDKTRSNNIDFKEFLSSILLNIKSSSNTNKKTLLDTNILTDKHNKALDQIDTKKDYHSISVDELLQFVLYLKSNSLKGNFPTDKKKLNEILHNKQAINEFKNIKNIKELFEVAKKYDIKITKFDISFEEDEGDNIASLKDIQKYLSKTKTGSAAKEQISSETILHLSKIKSIKNIKIKDNTEHTLKNILNNTKTAIKTKDSISQEKILSSENIVEQKHTKVEKETLDEVRQKSTAQKNIQIKQTETKQITKTVLEKEGKIIYQADKKDNFYQEKVKSSQKQSIEDNKDNKPHITRKNDIKIVSKTDIKESYEQEKRVLSDKNIVEQKHTKVEKETLDEVRQKSTAQKNRIYSIDNKNRSDNFLHHFHANKTESSSHILDKNLNPRPTLEQFANDLRNEIQNYKPPLTRVKMTLNPKDLGSVDVSIISRGNNLQININANSNTMAIFTQNQAEFKNALVNMGFTGLDMNFSSNSNSQSKQQNKNSNKESQNFEDLSESEVDNLKTISLSMPRYI